jgi:hypothetical protein
MPITQQRHLDLILSAEAMKDFAARVLTEDTAMFDTFARQVRMLLTNDPIDRAAVAAIANNLDHHAQVGKIRQAPLHAALVLQKERTHYDLTSRKNVRNQMYQQIRRRRNGIEPLPEPLSETEAEAEPWIEAPDAPATMPETYTPSPEFLAYKRRMEKLNPKPPPEADAALAAESQQHQYQPNQPTNTFVPPEGTNVPADLYAPKPVGKAVI